MPQAPIESIRAIIEYDWAAEQRDYEECAENGNEQAGHVFEHLQAVRKWLDEDPSLERARAISEGEMDGSVFVLFMRAQDVRDHYDGDEWAQPILAAATDEQIEALLGGEDAFYGAWHEMCRDVVLGLEDR